MPSFTFTSPEGKSYTVEGPEGATQEQAWGILQQQLQTSALSKPQISTMGAIGKALEQSVLPTLAGIATGAATGAAVGTVFPGPGNLIGSIVGGIGGGMAANYAQEKALEAAPETAKALGLSPEERAAAREQHPVATALAEAAPNLVAMRPTTEIANLFKAGATKAEKELGKQAAANALAGSALSGTIDVGQQVLSGQQFDPMSALIAAGSGALGMKETRLGHAINAPASRFGERIAGAKPAEAPPVPPKEPETPAIKPSESSFQDNEAAFNELNGTGIPPKKEIEPAPKAPPVETPPVETPPVEATKPPEQPISSTLGIEIPTVGGDAAVIQNRDRNAQESIMQMQNIAANPDYGRTSFSRTATDGAPIVYGNNLRAPINPEHAGKFDTVTLPDGSNFPVAYAALEANSLIPSHAVDGSPIPAYSDPNASGFKVAAGNGRAAGIIEAYARGNADNYVSAMGADIAHGINPEAIANMENPVLVRVVHPDQVNSRPNWGDLTNTAPGLELNPIETAKNDARRIDLKSLDIGENGVTPDAVRKFVSEMPNSERAGMLNADGTITPKAVDRLNAAIFQQAYDNPRLTELAYSSVNPEAKNVINALAKSAQHMMQLDNTAYHELKNHAAEAAEMAINASRQGMSLKERAQNPEMGDGQHPTSIFNVFAENTNAPKRTSEFLTNLAKFAYEEHANGAEDMFGEKPKRSISELIDLAKDTVSKKVEPKERVDATGRPLHDLEFGTEQDIQDAMKNPDARAIKSADANQLARKNGIDLAFDTNKDTGISRIDPRESTVDIKKLAKDKTVSDVVKRIIDFVPLDIKEILNRILPEVGDVKVKINNRRTRARGIYHTIAHDITIVSKAEGNNFSTITHEIVHSATERNYRAASGYKGYGPSNPEHIQAAKEIDSLFEYLKKHPKEKELRKIGGNIFEHPTELITWAMVDRPVQNILKSIDLPNGKNAFSSFVSSVRKLLGLSTSQNDALSRIIDIGERLTGKVHVMPDEVRPGVKREVSQKDLSLKEETGVPNKYEVTEATGKEKSLIVPQDESPRWWNKFMYYMVNKHIDLKNMHDAILKSSGEMSDKFNAFLQHTLSQNRRNHATTEYARDEVMPLMKKLKQYGLSIDQLDEYLHNKHAQERNEQNNKTNVDENGEVINPNIVNRGSGIHTEDAQKYLRELPDEQRAKLEDLAKDVRRMVDRTQDILVHSGQEKPETIENWRNTYGDYVPLFRDADELNFTHQGSGTGGGYSSIGNASKRAVGSTKTVGDIIENIGLQRIRAINRAEDIKVGQALYGQLLQHPMGNFAKVVNPDVVHNTAKAKSELTAMGLDSDLVDRILFPPKKGSINSRTGLAEYKMDSSIRSAANVLPVRINGEDRYIIFNTGDPVAMRMVGALKNADSATIPPFMRWIAKGTHFLSSVNTQYNPVFGAWNFMRDTQAGLVNLASTPLRNDIKRVTAGTFPALKTIYSELRARRNGESTEGEWADAYRNFEKAGGKLEFGTRIMDSEGKANLFASQLKDLNPSNVRKATKSMMEWLSDYNDSMENAVRLSTYKTAVDKGISSSKAAALANNITVNFNQKGQLTPYFASIFSFFNAGVQGTARLAETLNSPLGRKVVAGGLAIGAGQALALAAAGFDDNDIPDYVKEKNLIIPVGNGKYVIAPLPPGLNIIPNASRNITDYVLAKSGVIHSNDSAAGKAMKIGSSLMGSFNPLGTGPLAQQITPTLLRPVVAVEMNEDAFGRPISRKDQPGNPTPGYQRTRDNASALSKYMSEFLNYASGGTQFQKGSISPTGDDLDYLTGQYLGGVSREAMKAAETAKSLYTGEAQPNYRLPIVGKLYGDIESPQDIANRYYQNAERMAGYKAEIKGRTETKGAGNPRDVIRENPEAALYQTADNVHSQIVKLNKTIKEIQDKNGSLDKIQQLQENKTRIMKKFNDAVLSRQ